MKNMGGVNKRGLTISFLDGLNVDYDYNEDEDILDVYDDIIVNIDDDIEGYSIVMEDYFLYKVNVYGDVIIDGLSEVEDYFLRNSYIEGSLVLRDLSRHGIDFLYNTIIGRDLILNSIVKVEGRYLSNRFLNGELSMESLLEVENDYNIFNNITIMGNVNLPNLRYYNTNILSGSIIMGELTTRPLLYKKINDEIIKLTYIDYTNNTHFLESNNYKYNFDKINSELSSQEKIFNILNIPYKEVVSEWNDEYYLYEILQVLDLTKFYNLIDIDNFLYNLKITHSLEIKIDATGEELFKNSCIDNIITLHIIGRKNYSFNSTNFGVYGNIKIIRDDNSEILYNNTNKDKDKLKYNADETLNYLVYGEYLLVYTDDIGIINYMDISHCNINKEDCILNILYKSGIYEKYSMSGLGKLNNLYLLIIYLLFPEEKISIE